MYQLVWVPFVSKIWFGGRWLGAEFRKQAPRRLASPFLRDRWWRDYRGRNLRYGLWLRGPYGLHGTVSPSNTHSPIQGRSSSKQMTWWGNTRNLLKILCKDRKLGASFRLLLRPLAKHNVSYLVYTFFLSFLFFWLVFVEAVGHTACFAWPFVLQFLGQVSFWYCFSLFFINIFLSLMSKKKKKRVWDLAEQVNDATKIRMVNFLLACKRLP